MRKRSLALGTVVVLIGTACAKPADPAASSTRPVNRWSPTATMSPSPHPTVSLAAELVEPIVLPTLPPQGVVVDSGNGVAFVAFDGSVIARLSHLSLYYQWTVPGPVILRNRSQMYLLRVAKHALEPLTSEDAASHLSPQFQGGVDPMTNSYLDLPLPHGIPRGEDLGFWAYALPSPDGSTLLEQWSGECEVPKAFLAAADGSSPRAVTGAWGLQHAGISIGLGWTTNGRAVVNLLEAACGGGMGPPGIYLVDVPGEATLVHASSGSARMWGTA